MYMRLVVELAAEYGGTAVAGDEYVVTDHLGSTRLVVDGAGTVKGLHDYLPFGEEIYNGVGGRTVAYGGGGDLAAQRFTGKERDAETAGSAWQGLDYFGARYYSGAMGRFASPDPVMITQTRLEDPQGLNLFSYTRNRPLIAVDDGGLGTVVITVSSDRSANVAFYSTSGYQTAEYGGLARGQSRDRLKEKGDTPFGKYLVTGHDHGRLGTGYGREKIRMEPVAGENEALLASPNRTNLRIHGGGTSPKVVNPYADSQPLISTWGCVRLTNLDAERLWGNLQSDSDQDFVYVGNLLTLNIMGLVNADLRFALDKQSRFATIINRAFTIPFLNWPTAPADVEKGRKPPHDRELIPRLQ